MAESTQGLSGFNPNLNHRINAQTQNPPIRHMRNLALRIVTLFLFVFAFVLGARADGITNTFLTPQNFVANGVIGDTNWDGVYLQFGDLPGGGNAGGSGNGNTLVADSAVTFSGFMTVRTAG